MTVMMKSYSERDSGNDGDDNGNEKYLGHDSGNDGEEGVTAGINKCAECDSDDKKLP